jgi:hypothetical protein
MIGPTGSGRPTSRNKSAGDKITSGTRWIVAVVAGVTSLFGAYTYDYSESPVIADSTRWSSNGSPSFSSTGVTFSGSGGSLISQVPISVESGGSQNDYEVNTTLALNSGGGTYIHFLRASSNTVEAGSGSYVSVELVIPSGFSGSGAATLNVNQCTNGTVTQLGSGIVTASNGMTLRTVIWAGNLWIFVNNEFILGEYPTATAGSPGIGGYSMPSGSGFASVKLGHHDTVAPFQINANPIPSSVFPKALLRNNHFTLRGRIS